MKPSDAFLSTLSPTERAFYDDPNGLPAAVPGFVTKDSGARQELANGMVRDVEDDKTDYTLIFDGPMFDRWAALLTRGAKKYGPRNWTKALAANPGDARRETKERFKRSAVRHFFQWLKGDIDEDHAAAVLFNLNGYEAMIATDRKGIP